MDQRGKRYYYSHPYTPILDSIEEDEELHYTNSYLETYKNDRDDVRTRLMFLSFILFALYFIGPSYMLRGRDIEVIEDIPIIDWTNSSLCVPGEFRSTNELKFERMTLTFRNNIPIDIPIYFTHNLNLMNHKKVTTAVIVQHGNLRNANDYFCGLVNSLLLSQESDTVNIHNYAIIAPQFLTDGDLCWPPSPTDDALDTTIHSHAISIQNKSSWCGFQVWSSEGWKDGHASLDSSLTPPLYSYDVYNLLIERLLDRNYFPALRNITLFGFSAGAQVLLRYATYPNYKVPSNTDSEPLSNDEPSGAVTPVGIKFVISDPSTYLYFDKRRPYVTSVASSEETDSAVVNSATGNTTTNSDSEHSNSNSDTAAAQAHTKSIFSSLFELTQRRRRAPTAKPSSFRSTSYYDTRSRHSSTGSSSNTNTNSNSRTQRSTTRNARVHSSISKSLPLSRVTFGLPNSTWTNLWQSDASGLPWISTWETSTCPRYNEWRYGLDNLVGYLHHHSLGSPSFVSDIIKGFETRNIVYLAGTNDVENCRIHAHEACDDNELATYCQAMLQGNSRLDRIIKWKAYLRLLYGRDVHPLVFAVGVEHDPVNMVFSPTGRCVIFGTCHETM